MITFLFIVDWIDLTKEISSKIPEAREILDDKLERVDERDKKTFDETERQYLEGKYEKLREEIVKYYGNTRTNAGKDNECSDVQIPCDTYRIQDYITDEIFIKEKEFQDYNSDRNDQHVNDKEDKIEKEYPNCRTEENDEAVKTEEKCLGNSRQETNKETIPWRAKIISKVISFGEFALNYGTDPWSQVNPSNYLTSLSKRLTE